MLVQSVKHPSVKRPAPSGAGGELALTASGRAIQRKILMGRSNDPLEREADGMAEQVMRMAPSTAAPTAGAEAGPRSSRVVQRACAACEADDSEKLLMRRRGAGGESEDMFGLTASTSVENSLRTPGMPLDAASRGFFEPRFGHDFSAVRVHSDHAAATSARAVNALGYTVGNHIVFGAGQYRPHTQSGRKLLAHELAHTIQQSVGRAALPRSAQPVVQRYESGEHAKFGETGDRLHNAITAKAFAYKVRGGETIAKIAAKFQVTAEQLRDINRNKVRRWPATADPQRTVEGFEAGDSILIPPVLNEATKEALKGKELTFAVNGVIVSYGTGIALGDFYASAEDMLNAPAAELENLSNLIQKEKSGGKVSTAEWQAASGGRYLRLAERNQAHFAPPNAAFAAVSGRSSGDHKSEWEKNHRLALEASQQGNKDRAFAINAFADHFLTDAFAAGHLFNKQDATGVFAAKLPMAAGALAPGTLTFFNAISQIAFTGAVQAQFSRRETVACYDLSKSEAACGTFTRHAAINSVERFSSVLQGIHRTRPDVLQNAVAKGIHDNLNRNGVAVESPRHKWKSLLSGDGTLNDETREEALKAVTQSQLNVLDAFNRSGPLDTPALFKKVWDFVPHPTAGAGEKTVREAVAAGTDPAATALIATLAALITANASDILTELETMGILRRIPP